MSKQRKRRGCSAFLIILLLIAVLIGVTIDSNYRIDIEEYTVSGQDIPESFKGFRITQLSDIHAREFGEGSKNLIDKVKSTKPDIIAITGDLIDSDDQGDMVRTLMRGLCSVAPVYYVTGNHEWDCGGLTELFEILTECGVTALRNEYVILERGGDRIVLAGVDDPNGRADMKQPDELFYEIQNEVGDLYTVLLAHRNNRLEYYSAIGYDLIFCGHAHGGLIRLPFTDGLIDTTRELFPTHTSGLYYEGETAMLVSRGLGNGTGVPRFLNNPHIPVAVLG